MYECVLCHGPLVPLPENTETKNQSVPPLKMPGDAPGIFVTLCSHLFHGYCLQEWYKIQVNGKCPICRTKTLLEVSRVYPTLTGSSEVMIPKSTNCSHVTQTSQNSSNMKPMSEDSSNILKRIKESTTRVFTRAARAVCGCFYPQAALF